MTKKKIRLTENDLSKIIKESIKKCVNGKNEHLKWEKLFNVWKELSSLGVACNLNKDDKILVKNKVENNPQLMNYLNSGEYGKIIKELDDVIYRIGSCGEYFKEMEDYWQRYRDYENDTLW